MGDGERLRPARLEQEHEDVGGDQRVIDPGGDPGRREISQRHDHRAGPPSGRRRGGSVVDSTGGPRPSTPPGADCRGRGLRVQAGGSPRRGGQARDRIMLR